MIFEQLGLSVRITDSNGEVLPEYQVQETGDDTIQCWIPSTPGVNFQIRWKVTRNPHPKLSIRTLPFLDGVRMRGQVTYRKDWSGTGKLYKHQTGTSKARLYEFGTRDLTDKEDGVQPDQSDHFARHTQRIPYGIFTIDWLRARDIVPRDPELGSQDTKSAFKRERSVTPDIIDIDDLETDEEISTIKHLILAPATSSKRQRASGQEDVTKPKVEDD